MAKPPPLTLGQRATFIGFVILGPIIAALGIYYNDSLSGFLAGAVPGGGAAMTIVGLTMLFWRPEFGKGDD